MTDLTDAGRASLEPSLEDVGAVLGHAKRRASFATYALGLLADGERKSVEPIAARATGDKDAVETMHQRLPHFLTDSAWDDHAVRLASARYAVKALTADGHIG